MIFLLDNVSSLLVFATVAFVLTTTQFRAQQASAEQTIAYMSKKQTLEFADMLEQEFKLIGAGRDDTEDKVVSISTNSAGMTDGFSFWRADTTGTDILVAYSLTAVDSVSSNGSYITRYRVDRTENSAPAGGSPSTLRAFNINLLTSSGGAATPALAELVRVSFINMYPVGNPDDMVLRQTHWGITVRPLNLASD